MREGPRQEASSLPASAQFSTTHWSVVLEAGASQDSRADAALEELCRTYWHPIYCFARRRGQGPEDAQDLTQEFFKRLTRIAVAACGDARRTSEVDEVQPRAPALLRLYRRLSRLDWRPRQQAIRPGQ